MSLFCWSCFGTLGLFCDEIINTLLIFTQDIDKAGSDIDCGCVLHTCPDNLRNRTNWGFSIFQIDQDKTELPLVAWRFYGESDPSGTDIDLAWFETIEDGRSVGVMDDLNILFPDFPHRL
jgi:hypothetical protein